MKPYYETKLGKLYHGNCLEIMPGLEPVDLVLTDIPYDGVNRKSGGLRNLDKGKADVSTFEINLFINKLLCVGEGSFYIFCGWGQISEITTLFSNKLSTRLGVWEKTNPSPMNGEHIYLSGVEFFVYGKQPGGTFNAHCKNIVFRYPTVRGKEHPTQKPPKLFVELIEISTNEKDAVLDPCFGSGTTAIAREHLNRRWIGIEISEEYCEIAVKRIEHEREQLKMFK